MLTAERSREVRERADAAAEKPAALGPDVDLTVLGEAAARDHLKSLESLERQTREVALDVGIDTSGQGRSGSYFQIDRTAIFERVEDLYRQQFELMSTSEALERYDLEPYWWRLVDPDKDKYTSLVARRQSEGYFIRVFADQHVAEPIQSCLFVAENDVSQNVHNLVILEDGAEAHVITGCTIHPSVAGGLHAGISEFYLGKGAKLTFTMIHNWGEEFHVRPRTGVHVGEDATFVNNYVILRPVKSLQTNPVCWLAGDRSRAAFNSILYGREDSYLDVGSVVHLDGQGTRAEAVARAAAADRSTVYSRGSLIAHDNDTKAHLDCRGILFSDDSTMYAIPELISEGAPQAELSHEAAISPIAAEEVYYLMARGLPEDEAVSLITRGFLDLEIVGLPPNLRRSIEKALEATAAESL